MSQSQAHPYDPNLAPFVEDALMRMRYLYPSVHFIHTKDNILTSEYSDIETLRRDIAYTIYRAKIASDGADLRNSLLSTVMNP
jgi:hypothetical protein